jgi:hypothetical protein
MRRFGALMAVVVLALTACGTDQDPRLDPAPDAPSTTSDTLGRCPSGGPDATTPPVGCLDPEGRVVRG